MKQALQKSLDEITKHIEEGIIPFWLNKSIDEVYGGYLTSFGHQILYNTL